jgi:hypothetical protein
MESIRYANAKRPIFALFSICQKGFKLSARNRHTPTVSGANCCRLSVTGLMSHLFKLIKPAGAAELTANSRRLSVGSAGDNSVFSYRFNTKAALMRGFCGKIRLYSSKSRGIINYID